MKQKDVARFYANNPRTPTKLVMGGNRLAFANMPKEVQNSIKERLAEKDPVMREALEKNIIPGLKIDGKEVGKHNIHEFKVNAPKPEVKEKPKEVKIEKIKPKRAKKK